MFTEIEDRNGKTKRWVTQLRGGRVFVTLMQDTKNVDEYTVETFDTIWPTEKQYHHMIRTSKERNEAFLGGTELKIK